jgi:purine-nucleoside phosphorylase
MLVEQVHEATAHIQAQLPDFIPEFGIVLGTGLGALVDEIVIEKVLSYETIPHFPISTVETHTGKLILGTLSGKKVICMQGRFHYYEGYTMQQVTFPIRVMKYLGINKLIVSNASGALNPDFKVSDLMIIHDHISLFMPENPLTGKHYEEFGDRFPDMCDLYDLKLITLAEHVASELGIALQKGVYVNAPGPQLETRAEYRLLRMVGADAVGMSTVPEIIVAHQMGIRCFGISVITDMGIPETLQVASLEKIIAAANKTEPLMTEIIKGVVERA